MKTKQAIALCDCNSFYASCEAVYEPMLWTKPLVVLSSNDGSVVALNPAAKAIGIEKCQPFFKIRHLMQAAGLQVRSSNFELYGDMSARVLATIQLFSPTTEQYSIDEVFFTAQQVSPAARTEYARQVRATVLQHTGIPTSIGIAETKTLAKVAVYYIKREPQLGGVLDITASPQQLELLAAMPVREVWGIGAGWGKRLEVEGIDTALKLRELPSGVARQYLGVVGLRTVLELQGISCLPLELVPRRRKSLMVSRSFGKSVWQLRELEEAVSTFTARAAYKLRREQLAAGALRVFACSSRFKENYYYNSARTQLMVASNHTPTLIKYAVVLTRKLWRDNVEFAKAGVLLTRLVDEEIIQLSLFDDWLLQQQPVQLSLFDECDNEQQQAQQLMQLIDKLNLRLGKDTLRFAATGTTRKWQTHARYLSNRWTTRWDEIPVVRC